MDPAKRNDFDQGHVLNNYAARFLKWTQPKGSDVTERHDTKMDYRSIAKTRSNDTMPHANPGSVWTHLFSNCVGQVWEKNPNTFHEVAAAWANEAETPTAKGWPHPTHTHT